MPHTTHTISAFKFFDMFPNETSARVYFEKQMWNDKPVCPYCGGTNITTLKKEGIVPVNLVLLSLLQASLILCSKNHADF
jgi:hypothetical protein